MKLHVKLDRRSYPILIQKGAISKLPNLLKAQKNICLTNRTLLRLYQKKIDAITKNKLRWIVIPDGERHKNLKTVSEIYPKMIREKMDRKSTLVAFGGGVVGDIGGFVAATYLRGIDYYQVPTTLLAQVDSSVGGKTGVDLAEGKNLVGAFYQPKAVLIDTDFLHTLPEREFRCGMAEVIKYGILKDKEFFSFLEKNAAPLRRLDPNALTRVIYRCCQIKAEIVGQDERESGIRSLLNLGHTMGHAIETLSGYQSIRHGEAVARGLVYAAKLSHRLGLCGSEVVERIIRILELYDLPTNLLPFSKKAYKKVIQTDKKSSANLLKFVVIRGIGRADLRWLKVDQILEGAP